MIFVGNEGERKMSNTAIKRDFVDLMSYPAKKTRPLGKEPISVPRDPLITDYTPFNAKTVDPKNFSYSLYFTAFDVRDYGPDIKKFMKIFEPLSLKKVYLETYRDGYTADKNLLLNMSRALEKEGIDVSGAVTTTHFSDRMQFNEWNAAASCYTDKEANRKLKKEFEYAASLFDEIIIDDWFFTVCTCPSCEKARGKKSWGDFRGKLMADVSEKYVIEPAKKINKKVKLILKLPNWYEKFQHSGYDLDRLLPMYDEIAVGTETRDPHTTRFMPVHGALLFNYISKLAHGKVKKAWFDIYNCGKEIYTEQAYQSVLGGAEELILFCAGILPQPEMRPIVEEMINSTEKIDRMSHFKSIFKVPVIRDTKAEDEYKLEQYLLMAGIPLFVTTSRLPKEKIVILTAESCAPNERVKLFNAMIKSKKDIFMTAGFAAGAGRHFIIKKLEEPVRIESFKYNGREERMDHKVFIDKDVQGGRELCLVNGAYSLLSYYKIKDSAIWVFNVPFSQEEIVTHGNTKINAGLRFLLNTRNVIEAIKSPFNTYVNVNLYDKVKTLYKYKI
jgi:hypothetical protein